MSIQQIIQKQGTRNVQYAVDFTGEWGKFYAQFSRRNLTLRGISLYDCTFSAAWREGLPEDLLLVPWTSSFWSLFPSLCSFWTDKPEWSLSCTGLSLETWALAPSISNMSSDGFDATDLNLADCLLKKEKENYGKLKTNIFFLCCLNVIYFLTTWKWDHRLRF